MAFAFINTIGTLVIKTCDVFGAYFLFVYQILHTFVHTKIKRAALFAQMERIGIGSFGISVLTGTFSGAVLALQSYYAMKQLGTEHMIGPMVALSMARELGPVLTGLMITGRVGSSIAAELGTMSITEQLDALRTLCVDIYQYLVVPRVLAAFIILPFVTMFSIFFGILGGYIVFVYYFGLNPTDYLDGIRNFLELKDIIGGLVKAAVFGFILASVGCFKGYFTLGGAKDVGLATTKSVVIASVAILITNYFLAMLLFEHV